MVLILQLPRHMTAAILRSSQIPLNTKTFSIPSVRDVTSE